MVRIAEHVGPEALEWALAMGFLPVDEDRPTDPPGRDDNDQAAGEGDRDRHPHHHGSEAA